MGNRDKRGREKKKPKKQEIKQVYRPMWPAAGQKPAVTPAAPAPAPPEPQKP